MLHPQKREVNMDRRELTTVLQDPASAMRRLLSVWSDTPVLLMLDVDWDRGPLVLIGLSDRMMWPLLPPGSLLQLDQKVRTIAVGSWPEFERPIYLIEYRSRFYCCHAERRGETLRLISHAESGASPAIPVLFKRSEGTRPVDSYLSSTTNQRQRSGETWFKAKVGRAFKR